MELLFVFVIGAGLGTIARYSLPRRLSHGAFLIPALGAGVAMAIWVALTWAGGTSWLAWDAGWIWLITLAVTVGAVLAVDLILGARRAATDAELEALAARGIPVS